MNTPNFSDIYTLYFEDVYKYLLALCHDEELAEEKLNSLAIPTSENGRDNEV